MYINFNGSEIIYGELISGRAVAIFAAALRHRFKARWCFCSVVPCSLSLLRWSAVGFQHSATPPFSCVAHGL